MKQKKKEVERKEEEQLNLGIKEPFGNRFSKIRNTLSLAILKFEVKKFLKDPLLWATIVLNSILIIHQIYLIINNLSDLPHYLPIYRYFLSIPRKLVGKEHIIIFPTISVISFALSLIFTSRYYNTERILTKFLLFSSLLCTSALSIILIYLTTSF